MSSWNLESDVWSWENGEYSFAVGVAGARILSCKVAGLEILETEAKQIGSTFWTAPQSAWEWPPLPEHDEAEYKFSVFGEELIAIGEPDAKLGFRISKHFVPVGANKMAIRYVITNESEKPQKVAPWEITRVPAMGKTSFPWDQEQKSWGNLEISTQDGLGIFKHNAEHDLKFFGGALSGWIQHETADAILKKSFPLCSVEEAAEGESPIEIYAAQTYVEVEQQGAAVELQPGEMTAWEVLWEWSQLSK